ncbi:DUF742 domain-containing protein [Yinghuangia soli]|uniref:DUF742 domain-containing protein n=1 Tax=Yinghuangia soli TaxID=2908204 RepID=A0AA41Q213_9ACTN|nr:DUF742 domain-containing protein [Yinghuangia soli]MCF2529747.1 DUF742 domain-containing protein [Yinghuangia soli]
MTGLPPGSGEDGPIGRRTRPFALAGGQVPSASAAITMNSLVTAAIAEDAAAPLPDEWRAVLAVCHSAPARTVIVTELAARLHVFITPLTAMLGDLVSQGLIVHQPAASGADATNIRLLHRVRDGLARKL